MDKKLILAEAIADNKTKAEILAQQIDETQEQLFEYLNDLPGAGGPCVCEDCAGGGLEHNYVWNDGFRGGKSVMTVCLKCGGDIEY